MGRLGDASGYTLDEGAGRWFQEVGRHWAKPGEVARRLALLINLIGGSKPLVEITTEVVSTAIEKRRGMAYAKSPKPGARLYMPTNATVNRDVIDQLRPILRRASRVWGAKGLPEVNWKDLRLGEAGEVVKTYSSDQQDRWIAECDPVAGQALHLLLRYGLRFGELFFDPAAFKRDDDGPYLDVNKRKRDIPLRLSLREDDARLIAARAGRAIAAKLETIWFEEDARGKLISLTYHGLHARLESAAKRAQVPPGRVIHGTRHHAGTKIARAAKGDLRVAKKMLGHVSMASTLRYAHTLDDDLRTALDADSRVCPEVEFSTVRKVKPRKA